MLGSVGLVGVCREYGSEYGHIQVMHIELLHPYVNLVSTPAMKPRLRLMSFTAQRLLPAAVSWQGVITITSHKRCNTYPTRCPASCGTRGPAQQLSALSCVQRILEGPYISLPCGFPLKHQVQTGWHIVSSGIM